MTTTIKNPSKLNAAEQEMLALWKTAGEMDPRIHVSKRHLQALKNKQVRRRAYCRQDMFNTMAKREVAIFTGVPVLASNVEGMDTRESLVHNLSTKFPPKARSNCQVGPAHTRTRLPVREIMRRWKGDRAIVGVTDLHVRGTRLEELIDTRVLSDFNMLRRSSEDVARQEMMTLVISSPGNVTDSHSDDPDGTNHCFFGRKLWLAWETFEGMAAGMQDGERQDVYTTARFSMPKFLSLRSSRWFTVSTGDTLYLPANMTHKVITLDPYIGIGSFHVGLPGCIDNLSRWLNFGPLWSISDPRGENDLLVDEITETCLRTARRLQTASQKVRDRWGFDHMGTSYRCWIRNNPKPFLEIARKHSSLGKLIDIARSAA